MDTKRHIFFGCLDLTGAHVTATTVYKGAEGSVRIMALIRQGLLSRLEVRDLLLGENESYQMACFLLSVTVVQCFWNHINKGPHKN